MQDYLQFMKARNIRAYLETLPTRIVPPPPDWLVSNLTLFFLEYEDVLNRPDQRLVHGLAPEAIDEFLAELAVLIEPVEVHFQWRPQLRDPNDEMVLEAAINGKADALITYNFADFSVACNRFQIPVLHPADLLKKVKR